MRYRILVINPGSTSTKIAVYEDEKDTLRTSLEHPAAETARYKTVADQFEMRRDRVLAVLAENRIDLNGLAAVVGRGGMLPPVKSGAYRVNQTMVDRLLIRPVREHASNLGAAIAFDIAESVGVPAYIYDSVKVDELLDEARLTGLPEAPRTSICHALNSRAVAMKCAESLGKTYKDVCIIVAHMGGGISCSLHDHGRLSDVMPDNEGPFSPERAGRIPTADMVRLAFSGHYDEKSLLKRLNGGAGVKAHLGTVDMRQVEAMIAAGDKKARLVRDAMCYQVAKAIGELSTVVCGNVDRIVLTGGIAYSQAITGKIRERVHFIAPVEIFPGENEMEALARGALRVLRGEEEAREYTE
jgi:butyrate kinase